MTRIEKIEILEKLIRELSNYQDPETYHYEFGTWREKALRRLSELFGNGSLQVGSFERVEYDKPDPFSFQVYGRKHMSNLSTSATILKYSSLLRSLEEDLSDESLPQGNLKNPEVKKVFISHSSKDVSIGKEVITILQLIGVKPNQIFYTSAAGYGVPLGKDWVETLRSEVSGEGIVLSLLSEHYFNSQICLLEMGATWVLSKHHVPILIPPLTYGETNGVINTTQGFQILDRLRWSSLKRDLEKLFDLEPLDGDKWEPQRDAILDRITKHLNP